MLFAIGPNGAGKWVAHGTPLAAADARMLIARLLRPLDIAPAALQHLPTSLSARFQAMAPAVHVASASLEEALFKAIIRQVIRADHATRLLHRFVMTLGHTVTDGTHTYQLFPSAEDVACCDVAELEALGLGFKAARLRAVARELRGSDLPEHHEHLDAETLVNSLQSIGGIGPWSARTCVSDVRGAWEVYPFDDLAVRTWANRLWPEARWPSDPVRFERAWRKANGPHTGIVTFYLLSAARQVAGGSIVRLRRKEPTHDQRSR